MCSPMPTDSSVVSHLPKPRSLDVEFFLPSKSPVRGALFAILDSEVRQEENEAMKSSLGLFLAFLWISNPDSQKNNFVDLTRPPITHNQTEGHDRRDVTDGCEKADGGGIADGWVKPDGGLPRDILVQVLSVKNAKPALGSELEATVQLRNADARPIQIPWSTEQRIIRDGQKSDDLHWEAGTFEFMLRDGKNNHVRLKSETWCLYSS